MSKALQIKSLALEHLSGPSDVAEGQTTHAYHDHADVLQQPTGSSHVSRSHNAEGFSGSGVLISNASLPLNN